MADDTSTTKQPSDVAMAAAEALRPYLTRFLPDLPSDFRREMVEGCGYIIDTHIAPLRERAERAEQNVLSLRVRILALKELVEHMQ